MNIQQLNRMQRLAFKSLRSSSTRSYASAASTTGHVAKKRSDAPWIIGSTLFFTGYLYTIYQRRMTEDPHAHHAPPVKKDYKYKGAVDFHSLTDKEQDEIFPQLEISEQKEVLQASPDIGTEKHEVGEGHDEIVTENTDIPTTKSDSVDTEEDKQPSKDDSDKYKKASDIPESEINNAEKETQQNTVVCNPSESMKIDKTEEKTVS